MKLASFFSSHLRLLATPARGAPWGLLAFAFGAIAFAASACSPLTNDGGGTPGLTDAGPHSPQGTCAKTQDCGAGQFCNLAADGGPGTCATSCQASSACTACTCGAGTACSPGKGCVPLEDVGGPCAADANCNSGNCGTYAKTCRVPLGTACTAATCDVCITGTAGSTLSFCSRLCNAPSDCKGNGCISGGPYGFPYLCKPPCNAACPNPSFACTSYPNGPQNVCNCDTSGDCRDVIANPRGAPCVSSNSCASALCATADTSTGPGYRGECSATCATDADCGGGAVCVRGGFVDGVAATTGLCLPTCDATSPCALECVPRATSSGATQTVCDPRQPENGPCGTSAACLSGVCGSTGKCIPAQGAANGATCGAPTDCSSNLCENNICRGTSQIGSACTTTNDCAVGTCCATGKCC